MRSGTEAGKVAPSAVICFSPEGLQRRFPACTCPPPPPPPRSESVIGMPRRAGAGDEWRAPHLFARLLLSYALICSRPRWILILFFASTLASRRRIARHILLTFNPLFTRGKNGCCILFYFILRGGGGLNICARSGLGLWLYYCSIATFLCVHFL